MTVYELLFVLLFLATAATVVGLLVLVVTRRRTAAGKVALITCVVWGIYLVILTALDLSTRQVVVAPGQDRCFDEMCFAVIAAQALTSSPATPDHTIYTVTIRATSPFPRSHPG